MADETTTAAPVATAPAAEANEAAQAPTPVAVAQPGLITYIVQHRLLHNNHEYKKGDAFQTADEAVAQALRKAKAIALQTEVQAADEVAARIASLEAELAAAQAANARLMAAREQAVESAAAPAPAAARNARAAKAEG